MRRGPLPQVKQLEAKLVSDPGAHANETPYIVEWDADTRKASRTV